MDNGDISIENSLDEQHPHANNQQIEHSTQTQTKPEDIVDDPNKKIKKTPMTPTSLYIFFFPLSQSS